MEGLLNYSPLSLNFSIVPDTHTATYLTLTNVTSYPVAYKVKTTHLKRYCVRPNAAILSPSETLVVEIIQQAFPVIPPDFDDCRDRFLLQAVSLPQISNLPPNSPITTVWDLATEEHICATKFAVRLELADKSALAPSTQPPSTSTLTPETISSPTSPHLPSRPPPPPSQSTLAPYSAPIPPLPPTRPPPPPPSQNPLPLPITKAPPSFPHPLVHESASKSPPIETTSPPPASKAPPSFPHPLVHESASKSPPIETTQPPPASMPPTTTQSSSVTTTPTPEANGHVDYKSVAYTRARALAVRPAPKVSPPPLDRVARHRVAVERVGELMLVIKERQQQIDKMRKKLTEAKHKLSDAQMATRPAYDVRYEVDENARVPFLQICIMALISGVVLQLFI